MQLPASDELVLLSGMPPIRAKKLRYFEDRRFLERISSPPALADGEYLDRPPERPHDWTGCCAEPLFRDSELEDGESDGKLQQELGPDYGGESLTFASLDADDPLGLGEDEDQELAGLQGRGRGRTIAPILAADAINQGSDRSGDLMPSF
jgi:type IV secretion system protein VirD4